MAQTNSRHGSRDSSAATRRRVLQTIGASGVIGLAGCASSGGNGNSGGNGTNGGGDGGSNTNAGSNGGNLEGKKIHVLTDETGDAMRALHKEVKAEVEKQTGATVELEFAGFGQDVQERVLSLVQAGDPPEVFRTGAAEAMQFLNQDILAPVTGVMNTVIERYGEPPSAGRLVQDGEDYLVAPIIKPGFNLYRGDVFEKRPTTFAETLEQVKMAEEADNNLRGTYASMGPGFCTLLNQLGAVYSAGGQVCKRDSDGNVVPALHEGEHKEAWKAAMEYWSNMYQYSPDASDADCSTQQSAMVNGSTAHLMYMGPRPKIIAGEEGIKHADQIRLMQVPKGPNGEHMANALLDGWVTFEGSNTDAAQAYIKTLTQRKYLMQIYKLVPIQLLPAYDTIIESDEYQGIMDSLVESGAWTQGDIEAGLAVKDNFQTLPTEIDPPNPYSGAIYTSGVIAKVFQRVILRDENPDTVLSEAAQEIQGIING